MFNILFKRTSTAGNVPSLAGIQLGEILLNTADGCLYVRTGFGQSTDTVSVIGQNATTAARLATARQISFGGDIAGSVVFDGSTNVSATLTLPATGVVAGSYGNLTVDTKGRITSIAALSASNITTALGFSPVSTALVGAASGIATLDSMGKLTNAQIPPVLIGAVVYQGVWNASANTPALKSGTGTKGNYYKVATAGNTTLDGISAWNVGDSVIFDGTVWDKIDGIANEILSVNGQTGVVTISSITGNAATASRLASPVTISTNGDLTGAVAFDGSTSVTIPATLATVMAAGTYLGQTIDGKGRTTAYTPPTTLAGFGITDAVGSGTSAIIDLGTY